MNENEACGGKYKTLQLDDLLCVQSSVIIITIMMIPFHELSAFVSCLDSSNNKRWCDCVLLFCSWMLLKFDGDEKVAPWRVTRNKKKKK